MTGEINKFVFVAPMFNASKTLPRMLHSICGQSYGNWQLVLVDDVSTPSEFNAEIEVVKAFRNLVINPSHIRVFQRNKKGWETANVLFGIAKCSSNDIVCRIDADDALCDMDALAMLNSMYAQTGADAMWSMHRWGLSDRNISNGLPDAADPYTHPWVSSHLKTFRKRLIECVPYENFVNQNNELVRRCGDQAVYLPVLHNAGKRFFLKRVLYSYSIDEQGGAVYQTDDAKFQKSEAEFIRQRGYVAQGKPWELEMIPVFEETHEVLL